MAHSTASVVQPTTAQIHDALARTNGDPTAAAHLLHAEAWYKPKDVARRGITRWLNKDKLKAADAKIKALKREVKLADAFDDPVRQQAARRNLEAARAERKQLMDETTKEALEIASEG